MTGAATILHADLDAFYASVEVRDRPELRGRPVAVGGGVILAATYEARRQGVAAPMTRRAARNRCPGLIVLPPRFSHYVAASRAVMAVLQQFTPEVEPISIDEAFLDVTGSTHLLGAPGEIARALRAMVRREVGLAISVGVATTKHLAKIASRVAKPDGLVVVEPGTETAFLAPLPVGYLWGVGPVGERRLAAYGIGTIGQLAEVGETTLVGWFGERTGRHFWHLAHNRDARPVVAAPSRPGSVGAQSAGNATAIEDRHAALLGLADRVGWRLRRHRRAGQRITVQVRFSDMTRASRSITLPGPIAETTSLYHAAAGLADAVVAERAAGRGVTLVSLAVDRLSDTPHLQLEIPLGRLPADPALRSGSPTHSRLRSVDAAVDKARDRFGRSAVQRATVLANRPEERSPAEAAAATDDHPRLER
ncbi:MAG TPA: DNA polymerase IV [Actinobacteria bacterium]|nr:DNA polymerase IV [Actinomycetota bacterium]